MGLDPQRTRYRETVGATPADRLGRPEQALNNIGPAVWWNNLERIMLAVDDLGCRDLLA